MSSGTNSDAGEFSISPTGISSRSPGGAGGPATKGSGAVCHDSDRRSLIATTASVGCEGCGRLHSQASDSQRVC